MHPNSVNPQILAALSIATVWAPATAFAQDPATQLASPMVAIYIFSLVFGLGMAASYLYFRRRQSQGLSDPAPPEEIFIAQPKQVASERSYATPMHGIGVEEITSQPPIAQLLTGSAQGRHECPECGRHFDETLSVCPFDATPLRPQARRQITRPAETETKPTCPHCNRQYEDGARFCRHDGAELKLRGRLETLEPQYVCGNCGAESQQKDSECCDAPDIKTIDPSLPTVAPMFPMSICPSCHAYAAPGQSHCEHDDDIVRPMSNMNLAVLSITGMGPRRKICKQCGLRHSISAKFCARDGSELVDLN